jgi:hypothetical protein
MRKTLLLVVTVWAVVLAACEGYIIPPPTPSPSGGTLPPLSCPRISDPAPSCPGVALTGLMLTCGGPITATLDSKRPNRLGATLPNGSTVTGIVRSTPLAVVGEPCHGIGASFPITITFGLQYIGDLGPNAPICIARSKISFTQFNVSGGPFNSAWNATIKDLIKDKVHLQLDRAVVDTLNSAPGSPPRCANFRDLP